MPGSRKQEKTMHHHHQKQRCFKLCSRHCHHARALSQRSRRGRVSPMGQFKAWGPGPTTTSPRITSASRVYHQEHQIPKQGASADRIRHVRNGGEQTVRTIVDAYFVDGYDPLSRTIYELHGYIYHGCPTCFPVRDAKHYATPD